MKSRIINEDPKRFDKKRLLLEFNNIIKHIQKKPQGYFKFKKMRGFCGVCEWEEGIKLDYRKPVIPTLIHEVLHDLYPDNKEEWVLRIESKITQVVSSKDIFNLMNSFLKKLDID